MRRSRGARRRLVPDPAEPDASRWWSGDGVDRPRAACRRRRGAERVRSRRGCRVAVTPRAGSASRLPAPAFVAGSPIVPRPTSAHRRARGAPANLDADGVPLNLFADSVVSARRRSRRRRPATQSDWHNQTGRGVVPSVRPPAASRSRRASRPRRPQHDPYERNWIVGRRPGTRDPEHPGARRARRWELPPLTQSIFGGAPIAIALLALVVSIRRGRGIVVSIIAVVISGGVLAAGLLVDPAHLSVASSTRIIGAAALTAARSPASSCCGRRGSARPGRAPRAAAACTCRTARGSPCAARTSRRRGLPSDRPHASTVPAAASFCSSAAPRGTQSPCSRSQACRSSIARRSYLSLVEPTWQTSAGGSPASSRYIVYSLDPGGVVSSPRVVFRAGPAAMEVTSVHPCGCRMWGSNPHVLSDSGF